MRSRWARLARGSLGFKFAAISANAVSGIILAHAIGPHGRGVVAAVQAGPLLCAWIFSFGAADSLSRQLASANATRNAATRGAWLVILVPCAIAAVVALELGIPVLLAGQSEGTRALARIVALSASGSVLTELLWGWTMGEERFATYYVLRAAPSLLIAVGYVALRLVHGLTAEAAVYVALGSNQLPLTWLIGLSLHSGSIRMPAWAEVRSAAATGSRLYWASLSEIVNARLDSLLLPAFVGAVGVGLYSVAANLTFLIVAITGAAGPVLIPVATRDRAGAFRATRLMLLGTGVVAVSMALGMAVLAAPAITTFYGARFARSAELTWLLLPGTVLYACSQVLISGLIAEGSLIAASACQCGGVLVTLPGLILLLPAFGVSAAAVVSSASYACVFILAITLHARATRRRIADYVPRAGEVRWLVGCALAMAGLKVRPEEASGGAP